MAKLRFENARRTISKKYEGNKHRAMNKKIDEAKQVAKLQEVDQNAEKIAQECSLLVEKVDEFQTNIFRSAASDTGVPVADLLGADNVATHEGVTTRTTTTEQANQAYSGNMEMTDE